MPTPIISKTSTAASLDQVTSKTAKETKSPLQGNVTIHNTDGDSSIHGNTKHNTEHQLNERKVAILQEAAEAILKKYDAKHSRDSKANKLANQEIRKFKDIKDPEKLLSALNQALMAVNSGKSTIKDAFQEAMQNTALGQYYKLEGHKGHYQLTINQDGCHGLELEQKINKKAQQELGSQVTHVTQEQEPKSWDGKERRRLQQDFVGKDQRREVDNKINGSASGIHSANTNPFGDPDADALANTNPFGDPDNPVDQTDTDNPYKTPQAATATNITQNLEISEEDSNELLRLLTDYCNAKTSHKSKLANDLIKRSYLAEQFEIKAETRYGTEAYGVVYKEGKRPTTNAQLERIIHEFKETSHDTEKSPLLRQMNELYRRTFTNTRTAVQITEQKTQDMDALIEKAIQPRHVLNRHTVFHKKYDAAKLEFKRGVLNDALSDPREFDIAMVKEHAKPFRDLLLRTDNFFRKDKVTTEISNNQYMDILNPHKKIRALFKEASSTASENFASSVQNIVEKHKQILQNVIEELDSPENVAKILSDKDQVARDQAIKFTKEVTDKDKFKSSTVQKKQRDAAYLEISREGYCDDLLEAARAGNEAFSANLKQAYENFNIDEAIKDAKEGKTNTAQVIKNWSSTLTEIVTRQIDYDRKQRSMIEQAMKGAKIPEEIREKILADLKIMQQNNHAIIRAADDAAFRKIAKANIISTDFSAGLKEAMDKTTWQDSIPKWLRGVLPMERRKVAAGNRDTVFTEKYLNVVSTLTQLHKEHTLAIDKAIFAVDPASAHYKTEQAMEAHANEVAAAFRATLPTDKQILDIARQHLPRKPGIGTMLQKLMTNPITATCAGIAVVTTTLSILSVTALPFLMPALPFLAGIAVLAGAVMGVSALWHWGKESRARKAYDDMNGSFEQLALRKETAQGAELLLNMFK